MMAEPNADVGVSLRVGALLERVVAAWLDRGLFVVGWKMPRALRGGCLGPGKSPWVRRGGFGPAPGGAPAHEQAPWLDPAPGVP